jgi:NAD(P)-dependent dehydrogenase (short-subunit alcohol dehydrogenase family)
MQSKSVAIVTGASQGIGRATAIRLAKDLMPLSYVRGRRTSSGKTGSAALDPKPAFAAAATVNAAIIALAKAFAEQGIQDGVQVNSVVPGPVMTGRRRSFLDKWAPAHGMSVEEAMKQFPDDAGIAFHVVWRRPRAADTTVPRNG